MKADQALNHSAAHLLAQAVQKLHPGVKLAIGPAIEEGFYYDFAFPAPISEDDLKPIAKEMKALASRNLPFTRSATTKAKAKLMFAEEPFKLELIEELKGEISLYSTGDEFVDLCAGPHVAKTGEIRHFALLSTAGSYWRGDARKPMLTRIYGTAWKTKAELDAYLQLLQERKERDHRKIGKDLELFAFELEGGQGMPFWLPNGMVVKNQLSSYLDRLEVKYGFHAVQTPVMGNVSLYERSGHWAHYRTNMFPVMDVDGEKLVLRPMTCPHHCLIYGRTLRSYRDLPVRLCENAMLHRYEPSGSLTGLERVREMVLTDGHSFCMPEQIEQEIANAYAMISEVHKALAIEIDHITLSLRDPQDTEKYFDDANLWAKAEEALRSACVRLKIPVVEVVGEAAFYGPKIDMQAKTALGHEITISTLQLDFLLPERFDLSYKASDGSFPRPVLIHRGLIGTYERFIATLLEQTKGVLPLWLAPLQAVVIPVDAGAHGAFCARVAQRLSALGLRVRVDERDERLGKKIRDAQTSKVPYQLVVGDREVADPEIVSYRAYGSQDGATVSFKEFADLLTGKVAGMG